MSYNLKPPYGSYGRERVKTLIEIQDTGNNNVAIVVVTVKNGGTNWI